MDKEIRSQKKPYTKEAQRTAVTRSQEIVDSFGGKIDRKKDRAALRAIASSPVPSNGSHVINDQVPQIDSSLVVQDTTPNIVQTIDTIVGDIQREDSYDQTYLPTFEPAEIPPQEIIPQLPVRLSFFSPDANNQPPLQAFARQYWDPRSLAAMEAIAHFESPVKNDRSQFFLDREERKKQKYLNSHPDVTNEEYAKIRAKQLEQTKARTKSRGGIHLYNAISRNFNIKKESEEEFLSKHLGIATNALEEIHSTVYGDGESPLRNENQLPSISPWHDMMSILSPGVDLKRKEQTKAIYLTAHESAQIEVANPKKKAGEKLSLIQQLFNETLFEGMSGETQDVTIRAIFSKRENLLEAVKDSTEEISTHDLRSGQRVKEITLPMRVMQDTGILMYTSANEKSPTSGLSKAFKKALLRAKSDSEGKIDAALDSTNDVTDTYRIKFAVMGGETAVDAVMYRVLEILTNPDNKAALLEHDKYGQPVPTDTGTAIVKTWEDDSEINRTPDQPKKDPVFRNRVQIHFSDLHHPVEIMFQSIEEYLKGEYNVGHYDPTEGKYTSIAHSLYEIARAKLVAGVIFDRSVYTDPKHQDIEGAAKRAMENQAQELKKRNVVVKKKV